jgi:hypothetical protein
MHDLTAKRAAPTPVGEPFRICEAPQTISDHSLAAPVCTKQCAAVCLRIRRHRCGKRCRHHASRCSVTVIRVLLLDYAPMGASTNQLIAFARAHLGAVFPGKKSSAIVTLGRARWQ